MGAGITDPRGASAVAACERRPWQLLRSTVAAVAWTGRASGAREPLPGSRAPGLSGRWIATIAVGIVVLVCVAVASATSTSSGRRSTANDGGLKKVWSIPSSSNGDMPIGRWLTGKLLVRASSRGGVRAYNTADGSEVYRISPNASGPVLCAMSTTLSPNGIGTVAFGDDSRPCTRLAGVDARSGRILWSIPLVSSRQGAVLDSVQTYIQGDIATVIDTSNLKENVSNGFPGDQDAHVTGPALIVPTRNSDDVHGVTAFDPTTGAQLWTYTGDSHTGATLVDASGDGRLYAVSAGSPAGVPCLVRLDPATGHSTPLSPLPSTDSWTSFLGTVYALPGGGIVEVSALDDTSPVIAYR
jgi:hypothetical protein